MLNTVTFAYDITKDPFAFCKVGVFCSTFFFIGAMTFILARMYRMFKFFSLYEICLIHKSKA